MRAGWKGSVRTTCTCHPPCRRWPAGPPASTSRGCPRRRPRAPEEVGVLRSKAQGECGCSQSLILPSELPGTCHRRAAGAWWASLRCVEPAPWRKHFLQPGEGQGASARCRGTRLSPQGRPAEESSAPRGGQSSSREGGGNHFPGHLGTRGLKRTQRGTDGQERHVQTQPSG